MAAKMGLSRGKEGRGDGVGLTAFRPHRGVGGLSGVGAELGHNYGAEPGHNFGAEPGHNYGAELGRNYGAEPGHIYAASRMPKFIIRGWGGAWS